jgi:SOS-response transcriptional repressor LexA
VSAVARGLTARQHQLLTYLASRAPASPSIREMSRAVGILGSNASGILVRLERDGWIRRREGRARAIEIVRNPPPLAPLTVEQGLAYARAWRVRMKPYFDALYGPEAAS